MRPLAAVQSIPDALESIVKPRSTPATSAQRHTGLCVQRHTAYRAAVPKATTPTSEFASRPCANNSGSKIATPSASRPAVGPHNSFAQRKTIAAKITVRKTVGRRVDNSTAGGSK